MTLWVSEFQALVAHEQQHQANPSSNLYAIVDAALDRRLWQQFARHGKASLPLLRRASSDSVAAGFIPHLVLLDHGSTSDADAFAPFLMKLPPSPAFTLLSSPMPIDRLRDHFHAFLDVELSGGLSIFLAFWDPAILGALVGQADDHTLHIPGPVFNPAQLGAFLAPLSGWWYTDRESRWHSIGIPEHTPPDHAGISLVRLTQEQEDQLIEAGLPDQVLYDLESEQPLLFPADQPQADKYRSIRIALEAARKTGLDDMRDLVNFVVLRLAYGERMQTDARIPPLLNQVRQKQMTLDQAMKLMPE